MKFSIETNKARNVNNDLKNIENKVNDAKINVETIGRNLDMNSDSTAQLKKVIASHAAILEKIIDKLATMDNGLERAIELYTRYENILVGNGEGFSGVGDKGKIDANASAESSKKKNIFEKFWEKVTDGFGTGQWNDHEKADRIRRDKAMAKELKSVIKKNYSKKAWKKASVEERKEMLRNLFNDIQSIYGVHVGTFNIEKIPSDPGYITYGYYSDGEDLICINEDLLSNDKYYDKVIETMAHEMRHAYQHEVIEHPENFNVDKKTVEEWRENFKDYKTTEEDGFKAYRDQPVEKDARKFASYVI